MSTSPIDPRIAGIEAQINACMRGATNTLNCPYCKAQVTASDEALCCADFGAVVRVILRKQAQQECMDAAHRLADVIASQN